MCYSTNPGRYGWCGTCYEGNKNVGEEGYCDYFHTGTETKLSREASRPSATRNWGWCTEWCGAQFSTTKQSASQILQVFFDYNRQK